MRRSVVVSTLGITQTLAWGSTYYLAAVFADPISRCAAAAARLVLRHILGARCCSRACSGRSPAA